MTTIEDIIAEWKRRDYRGAVRLIYEKSGSVVENAHSPYASENLKNAWDGLVDGLEFTPDMKHVRFEIYRSWGGAEVLELP